MNTLKRYVEMNSITDLSDVNIFKITHSFSREFPMALDGKLKPFSKDLALPFSKCFVDFNKSYIYTWDNRSLTTDSILFEEISPNHISVIICLREYMGITDTYAYLKLEFIGGQAVIEEDDKKDPSVYGHLVTVFNVISRVFEELCSRKYIYVENNEKIDVKFRDKATRKLNRVKYTPKMIIYVSDKKTFKNEHPELSGRIISKPSFAYECMGHYRKLHCEDWFGHDRQGKVVQGWTYVNPHVRCADRGEVIKKVRVIQ